MVLSPLYVIQNSIDIDYYMPQYVISIENIDIKKDNILLVLSPLYVIHNSIVIDYYMPQYFIY